MLDQRTSFEVPKPSRSIDMIQFYSLSSNRPSPLTLEFTALVGDAGLRAPSVYQV